MRRDIHFVTWGCCPCLVIYWFKARSGVDWIGRGRLFLSDNVNSPGDSNDSFDSPGDAALDIGSMDVDTGIEAVAHASEWTYLHFICFARQRSRYLGDKAHTRT